MGFAQASDPYQTPPPASERRSYRPPWQAAESQFSLVGSFGFGGSAFIDGGFVGGYQDLDTTYGVHARLLIAASPYFAIGPSVGTLFWRTRYSSYFGSRNILLDIDLNLKLRYPFSVGSSSAMEVYLLMPGGFTVSFPQSGYIDMDTGYGWNLGLHVGTTFFLRSGFGLLFELGWMRHQAWHGANEVYYRNGYLVTSDQVEAVLNQFTLQTGVVVLF